MSYRGDGEASPARLKQLDERIVELERCLSPVFWERVAVLWGASAEADADLPPLARRHDRIARLEDAIERARSGPAAALDLPPEDEPDGTPIDVRPRSNLAFASAEIRAALRDHEPAVQLRECGEAGWGARIRVEGAPVEVGVRLQGGEVHVSCLTTIAPAAQLDLRPKGLLREVFGLGGSIEVRSEAVDRYFEIQGDERTAWAFLGPAGCQLLVASIESAVPHIHIGRGIARIEGLRPRRKRLSSALRLLALWHATPSPRPLLQGEDRG